MPEHGGLMWVCAPSAGLLGTSRTGVVSWWRLPGF